MLLTEQEQKLMDLLRDAGVIMNELTHKNPCAIYAFDHNDFITHINQAQRIVASWLYKRLKREENEKKNKR